MTTHVPYHPAPEGRRHSRHPLARFLLFVIIAIILFLLLSA